MSTVKLSTPLKALHVEAYALDALRLARQHDYARALRRRRPARFREVTNPRRTLERVCFLRITLLQATDVVVSLADLLMLELHARTVKEVREAEARVARTFKPTLREMRRLLDDSTLANEWPAAGHFGPDTLGAGSLPEPCSWGTMEAQGEGATHSTAAQGPCRAAL
jgi:hypothetical protein